MTEKCDREKKLPAALFLTNDFRQVSNSCFCGTMIKAARKAAANAELAQAFADIFRAPTHEHEGIFAKNEQKDRECECVERCESAVRAKQRGL
jgi:hypothetical protein